MSGSDTIGGTDPTRNERTAERVGRVGRKGPSSNIERWLLIVGGTLLPLGLLLIVLGWMGASQTPLLFEQIPYLISGGLLGLGFVFAGGFVYFAYWHTVVIRDSRAQTKSLAESLGRIESLLAQSDPGALAGGSFRGSPGTNGRASASRLVSTPNGTMFHRSDCPVVTGREGLRPVDADDPGLRPCLICEPLSAATR